MHKKISPYSAAVSFVARALMIGAVVPAVALAQGIPAATGGNSTNGGRPSTGATRPAAGIGTGQAHGTQPAIAGRRPARAPYGAQGHGLGAGTGQGRGLQGHGFGRPAPWRNGGSWHAGGAGARGPGWWQGHHAPNAAPRHRRAFDHFGPHRQ